ncbi:MAG: hypothetical protein JO025_11200, partial [Verrucomicrobia bacterium]|nr:hypothetical protein [Verrucomicrobiota bacterium]
MSINGNKLNAVYRDCIEQLCEHFFPHGKRIGADWSIGDTSGAPGKSLRISLVTSERTTAGVWHDQATGEGGTFAELIQASRGVTFPEAATLIGNVVGVDLEEVAATGTYGPQPRRPAPPAQLARGSAPFDWAGPQFEDLNEGRKQILSDWRGYSPEFVEWLASE